MDLNPYSLGELRDLAEATVLIAAAHEVGLLRAVGEGEADPHELAGRLGLDLRATGVVCRALAELGFLEEVARGRFRPTARCRAELCDSDGPGYLGGGLSHWLATMRSWCGLDEALRRGGPLDDRPAARSPERVARFMSAMAAAPSARVRAVVNHCLARRPGARAALDLGGGPGHIARGFAERGVSVTLVDTAEVVEHVVDAYRLGGVEGLTVVAGDIHDDPLPEGPYDVALLSNVLHIYGPEANRALLARVADVVRPGGVVAVAELLRGRSGRAGRFGVQMLLHTEEGDAWSQEEVLGWLDEAGFGDPEVADLDPDRQLVTALKG